MAERCLYGRRRGQTNNDKKLGKLRNDKDGGPCGYGEDKQTIGGRQLKAAGS